MVRLSAEDHIKLATILQNLPSFDKAQSRRHLLELAGLDSIIPHIDLSGSAAEASLEIVAHLTRYGKVTYDQEALGRFLNAIIELESTGLEQRQFLAKLLTKYNMMTPVAAAPDMPAWWGSTTTSEVLEKIIGEDTLRPIAFLEQSLHVAQSVAYVGAYTGSGTGFLITLDLLLTNQHVLPQVELASGAVFRFNYQENWRGEAQPVQEYRAKPDGIFHASERLDYAVVELEGRPGQTWGWLPLRPREVRRDDRVNIIQHPGGRPKQISLQNNFVEYVGGGVVQYVTSTLAGSSGSPVFDDRWEVVALHHAGGKLAEPTTQRRHYRNEGILISRILADLPAEVAEKVNTASGS